MSESRFERGITRRELLQAGAAGGLGLYLASPALAARRAKTVTINWEVWSDHYDNQQLAAVKRKTGIEARPNLFSDNIDAYLKVKSTGSQFDIVSGDALWVAKYVKDGLAEPFDLSSLPVSKQLFSVARQFPFWQSGSNYMGYPFSWSTVQIYYNPKFVKTAPDSWHALLDKRYAGKISLENIATDMMAIAGKATGAKDVYNMTPAQISSAKQFLAGLKPNVLKLASQNNEVVRALADESAWIGITNLGTDDRVKDAGGPVVKVANPKEGTIGFIDAELRVKASKHKDVFEPFINAMEQAPWIAKNFLTYGRPLFNEQAWKILVNQGHKARAQRLLYNQPERALQMTIKGPAGNQQAYVDAFNEVFGA